MYWRDAKFGTIPNLIIIMVAISAYGNYKFKEMVTIESNTVLKSLQFDSVQISNSHINNLPLIVQKWMESSGVIGKERAKSVQLTQKGEMKIKPNGKWIPFNAKQYFNIEASSFIWTTEVDMKPFMKLVGRDKLYNGKGEMLIKLSGVIPVVNESNNSK